jgi:hypothetical protein
LTNSRSEHRWHLGFAISLIIGPVVALSRSSAAEVTIYNTYSSWHNVIGGGDAEIDFHLTQFEPLHDQYAYLGAHFDPGCGFSSEFSDANDDWGAITSFSGGFKFGIDFDAPQAGLGLTMFTQFKLSLFANGQVLYESDELITFGPSFRGIVTSLPFDRVEIYSMSGPGFLDDIFVANPIPTPPVAAVLLGMLAPGRSRRRRAPLN